MSLPAPTTGSVSASPRVPLAWRLRELVMSYLPLLLMLALALTTWWLVKNTPHPEEPRAAAAPRHEPDYTMQRFSVQRFTADGRLRVRIEGQQLRHYPDTDTVEIDAVRIHALGVDGRTTEAVAQRALANGDGSEVQLLGGAQVISQEPTGEPIEFRGEFLHAFLHTEQLRSHLPVQVRQGSSELRADGMEYDNLSRIVQLKGQVRASFVPASRR